MIDLSRHDSLGSALDAALERFAGRICLIEADRERENCRLTYADFATRGRSLAGALARHGFGAGHRAALIMTNQSKWLLSAYAVFRRGAVLVPLDFKLSSEEHAKLLAHAGVRVLVTEFPIWRQLSRAAGFVQPHLVLVSEAPAGADLAGARRWEEFRGQIPAGSTSDEEPMQSDPGAAAPGVAAQGAAARTTPQRSDLACIVYSSGTGGRPKGCMLTHNNYLEQCAALTRLYALGARSRYLSILPTNHAIDFMVGFIGPFVCGATVVHLRTLRPEFVREAFPRYGITHMALVPMVLKNLERGLRQRLDGLPPTRRALVRGLVALNRAVTGNRPRTRLSRRLLWPVHRSFGGKLEMFFVGGAFTEPETLQFFFDLGIPVANGYGLTEAGTVVTVNDMRPFRADTVGKALPGTEVRIASPGADGIGEVAVRGPTVMSGYLDDAELTSAAIVDGWLMTGDLGKLDASGHLQLFGRKKNMIVTAGGKNIYPEDIENAFVGIPVPEYCVFAANYLWPQRELANEKLVMVLRLEPGKQWTPELQSLLEERNQRLPDFKRIHGFTLWSQDFPRTASLKVKRDELAEQVRETLERQTAFVEI